MHELSGLLDQNIVLESQIETLRTRAVAAEAVIASVRKWCHEAKEMQPNPSHGISTYAIHTVNAYHSAAESLLEILPKGAA